MAQFEDATHQSPEFQKLVSSYGTPIRVILLTATSLTLSACTERVASTTRALSASLTGSAAAAVMPNGQFALATGSSDELTEVQAKALAAVFARTFGRWLTEQWSHDHGARVDVDALVACGRAFYARSAFDHESFASTGPSVRTLFDAKWLVTLCGASGQPEVSVALSADATKLQIVEGHINGVVSGEFLAVGIPKYVHDVPPPPEKVAALVARATGRRISAVPELVLPPPPYTAQLARWRLELDAPVKVRGGDGRSTVNTSELYYGFGQTWRTTGLLLGGRRAPTRQIRDLQQASMRTVALLPGYVDDYKSTEVLPQ